MRAALSRHRSVILALQTGGGKTVIACDIIKRVIESSRRAMFVVHRVELVEQAVERLQAFGIKPGVIKAGYKEHRERPIQVACVPTLVRRHFPDADLVIFDECHHGVSPSWFRVLDHYREIGAWVLGITATPQRLDGKPLGDAFDAIVEPVTTRDLINQGHLIEPTVFAPPVDLEGVKTRMGDYSLPELAEKVSPLTGHLTRTWAERAKGIRTLAFAVNVRHSLLLRDEFEAVGARVVHVDGKSSSKERRSANERLRSGELDVVTQCQLWTEGVDIPELGCLVIARPTQSLSLHRQMIGRVMRTAPGKSNAIVLDHAGNTLRHGLITEEIEWSLDGIPKKDSEAPPVKTCKECFAIIPLGAVACPECGWVRDETPDVVPPRVDNPGKLIRIDMTPVQRSLREKQVAYIRMVRDASMYGYKLGQARVRYKEQFGSWPKMREIERANYRCREHVWEEKEFGAVRVRRCERCYVDQKEAARDFAAR